MSNVIWNFAKKHNVPYNELVEFVHTVQATTVMAPQPQPVQAQPSDAFQQRVSPWMQACFGPAISADKSERNHRFLEESLELVQACGCTEDEAHQLVSYVYGRPTGEPAQEVGGVMVTLAALCLAQGLDMHANGETELARIWTKVDQIRAKQAAKPKHSPLPVQAQPSEPVHFRAMLDPEQVPHQLKTSMHVVGFRSLKLAEAFVDEQTDFYGWRYTIEPLYSAPVAQPKPANQQKD